MIFDPEVSISFEGETGPYVQYAYARICSVLRKAGKYGNKINYELLNTKEEEKLVSLLNSYPEKVSEAGENYRPHIISRYLIDLAQALNEFYHSNPILQAEKPLMEARLKLITAVKQVLENGLALLAIDILEEM
jgi:arginyl-tRNA synthetase